MNADNFRPEPGSGSDDELRHLLNDAVSDVEPHDALDSIRSRTSVNPLRSRRPWILGAGAAALATAATITAVAAMGNNPGTTGSPETPVAGGAPAGSESPDVVDSGRPDPSTQPSSTRPSQSPEDVAEPQSVPVYYVGATSHGPRLYREFHLVAAAPQNTPRAALAEAMAGSPDDPDYRTDWPQGASVTSVTDDGALITVDLGGAGTNSRPAGMTEQDASIAVEQLIYTAQAVLQTRDPVQFLLDGQPADTVLGVPTSDPTARGQEIDVLAMVWIIDPTEGTDVASGFTVSGLANAFEANVQWELMQGDQVVKSGFTTAEECCTMAPYSFPVTAPPGDYTIVVHDSDPSDGAGLGPTYDSKAVTIG